MARSSPIWTFYSVENNDDDKAKCKLCLIIIFLHGKTKRNVEIIKKKQWRATTQKQCSRLILRTVPGSGPDPAGYPDPVPGEICYPCHLY